MVDWLANNSDSADVDWLDNVVAVSAAHDERHLRTAASHKLPHPAKRSRVEHELVAARMRATRAERRDRAARSGLARHAMDVIGSVVTASGRHLRPSGVRLGRSQLQFFSQAHRFSRRWWQVFVREELAR